MPQFAPVTPDVVAALTEIVGADYVVTLEPDLSVFGRDETEDLQYRAEVAVRPDSTEQVSQIAFALRSRNRFSSRRSGLGGGKKTAA